MLQDNLSRFLMKSMRGIGVVILILGVTSLAFGIVLLVAANTAHSEEVEQLEMELSPTTIGELKDLRETIRDYRYLVLQPQDVQSFIQNPASVTDPRYLAWHSLLLQEKGISVALINLGTAQMITYAGIGTLILSIGLIVAGLLVIVLGPGINQMRKAIAELNKASEVAPKLPEEVPSEN